MTAERAAYLARTCGQDAELRRQLERLLRHLDRAGNFLTRGENAAADSASPRPTAMEKPSQLIGHSKLFQETGEGGPVPPEPGPVA